MMRSHVQAIRIVARDSVLAPMLGDAGRGWRLALLVIRIRGKETRINQGVESVVTDVRMPAGVAGPDSLDFDVRCFLVPHAVGVVLIDTCMPGSNDPINAGLERIGAEWRDITDIVLTHNHPDHTGGLAEVMARTDGAAVWAGAEDQPRIPFDGQLRTIAERWTGTRPARPSDAGAHPGSLQPRPR